MLSPEDAFAWTKGKCIFTDGQLVRSREQAEEVVELCVMCIMLCDTPMQRHATDSACSQPCTRALHCMQHWDVLRHPRDCITRLQARSADHRVQLPDGRRMRANIAQTAQVFPGIGLGAIMSRTTRIRDEMVIAAAQVRSWPSCEWFMNWRLHTVKGAP